MPEKGSQAGSARSAFFAVQGLSDFRAAEMKSRFTARHILKHKTTEHRNKGDCL